MAPLPFQEVTEVPEGRKRLERKDGDLAEGPYFQLAGHRLDEERLSSGTRLRFQKAAGIPGGSNVL